VGHDYYMWKKYELFEKERLADQQTSVAPWSKEGGRNPWDRVPTGGESRAPWSSNSGDSMDHRGSHVSYGGGTSSGVSYGSDRGENSYRGQSAYSTSASSGRMSNMDKIAFESVLNSLKPTQQSIGGAKDWIMGRKDILSGICQVIGEKTAKCKDFNGAISILYLVNDVLMHSSRNADTDFASALESNLSSMIRGALSKARGEEERKVTDLVSMWQEKRFLDSSIVDQLMRSLGGGQKRGRDY